MELERQKQLSRDYGFHLGSEYRGNNGARVVPLEIWEHAFDGSLLVRYNASHHDMDGGKWVTGDTTLNSMAHWLGTA